MKTASIIILMISGLALCISYGPRRQQSGRYVRQYNLLTGLTAVVAEGDFEPRSMGSYTVKIYDVNPEFPTDRFLFGVIRPRNGSIEKVTFKDIDGDDQEEIIVINLCTGLLSDISNFE